jgi:hypothetical protein
MPISSSYHPLIGFLLIEKRNPSSDFNAKSTAFIYFYIKYEKNSEIENHNNIFSVLVMVNLVSLPNLNLPYIRIIKIPMILII